MPARSEALLPGTGRHWRAQRTVLLDLLVAMVPCHHGAVREYRLVPGRRWRADLAWPAHRVAIDVQGGIWVAGHHVRGAGYRDDVRKIWAAAAEGWRLLPVTWDLLADLNSRQEIARILRTYIRDDPPSGPGAADSRPVRPAPRARR